VVAPGLFAMQAIGRWGNFFNQELYGPPTSLPWGIAIDCAHRVAEFPCDTYPLATTAFHPLFLYESISGILGALFLLWLGRRYGNRLRSGDMVLVFFIWYPIVRFLLETLRTNNWTVGGIPTAQLVSVLFILIALLMLLYRHRSGASDADLWPEVDPFAAEDADPFDEDDPFGDNAAFADDGEPGDGDEAADAGGDAGRPATDQPKPA
jgi:phosphatidylglycerol:prolipoprotein diacylglycerol transferase